jgi:hypothetical protein
MTPEHKNAASRGMTLWWEKNRAVGVANARERMADPAKRAAASIRMKNLWRDPAFVEKVLTGIRNKKAQ